MSIEFNKILASVLLALILGMVASLVAAGLVSPVKLETAAYPIAGGDASAEKKAPAEAAPAKPDPIPTELLAKADPAAGEAVAKKCGACHSFDKGGPNRVGPNLWGVLTRARGTAPDFSYSDAIKKLGGNWSPQEIAAFVYNPKLYANGTKMGFAGLPKAEDRANLLAYLDKMTDTPVDLTK